MARRLQEADRARLSRNRQEANSIKRRRRERCIKGEVAVSLREESSGPRGASGVARGGRGAQSAPSAAAQGSATGGSRPPRERRSGLVYFTTRRWKRASGAPGPRRYARVSGTASQDAAIGRPARARRRLEIRVSVSPDESQNGRAGPKTCDRCVERRRPPVTRPSATPR